MFDDARPPARAVERWMAIGKDLFALLRDGALFVLAVLLLFFPQSLNDVLTNAGFEEGSIVGFKWKARLVESNDALTTAKATIESLQLQLKHSNDALAAATSAVPSGELRTRIESVERSGRQLEERSAGASEMVGSTISANAPLVERAQAASAGAGAQVVVMGSDRTLEAARDEVRRANRAGIENVSVYLRNGYFATITVVDSRDRADEVVRIARGFRPDAYVARLSAWCVRPMAREGFTECAPTR